MKKYNPEKIEKKWQKYWEANNFYHADNKSKKTKFYQLETFPYPSAAGLHVGHPKGYIAEDIHARYIRMKGYEVLYTMGWDAFGLPTENYAIKIGKNPKEVAKENIKNFKRQIKMFGLSYDWSREINTSSPQYYKWTQWLFIELFKAGLAYQAMAKINWCPKDQTVLANEQVINGRCERCGELITQKEMKQWFFKITEYKDRLLKDLNGLDWPETTIKRQEDWIGKSEGAKIKFPILNLQFSKEVEVFTTRPDTLFGATFIVASPELAKKWLDADWNAEEDVREYIKTSLGKKELDRLEQAGEKTGVFTGIYAINPATKEKIPVWVADYVLGHYSTGAVMAVPAHDKRDFEFAKKFKLPIKKVIFPRDEKETDYFAGEGRLINSDKFDGMDSEKAKWEITKFVGGERRSQYKLRDWSVSRQRYWGVPIPIIYCEKCGPIPVPEEDLPVELPNIQDYRPKGIPPLASSKKFIEIKCPKCEGSAERDPETLDTFVDSSWYYLRYTDPKNDNIFASLDLLKHWMPVDLYLIGAEHTVLHLLYSRFITKFLFDRGYLNFKEPFLKLRHVGLILGTDGQKMSKSRGNVVNPDDLVKSVGADSVRLYEMFMGPFEEGQPWDSSGINGVFRFLNRVWNMGGKLLTKKKNDEIEKELNKTIKKVGEDIENLHFNTAISEMMKFLNKAGELLISRKQYEMFLKLLSPFAPHISEEIWQEILGNKKSIHLQSWPKYESHLAEEKMADLIVQVNGKTRGIIKVQKDLSEGEVKKIASSSEKIHKYLEGKIVKKIIYVKDKLVNIVM